MFLGVNGGRCLRLTSQLFVSWLSRKCGILDVTKPYRPPRPVTGIALLFNLFFTLNWTRRARDLIMVLSLPRNTNGNNIKWTISGHRAMGSPLYVHTCIHSVHVTLYTAWSNDISQLIIPVSTLITIIIHYHKFDEISTWNSRKRNSLKIPPQWLEKFLKANYVRTRPTQPPIQLVLGAISSGVTAAGAWSGALASN
jgi:hypothetical protein